MKDLLLQFLKLLWDMAKHIQDEYLRVTLKTEGEKPRKTWFCLASGLDQSAAWQYWALGILEWPELKLADLTEDLVFGVA